MVRKKMEFLVHIRRWNYTITDHWSGERQASEKTAISTSVGATGVGECEKQGAACIRKREYGISGLGILYMLDCFLFGEAFRSLSTLRPDRPICRSLRRFAPPTCVSAGLKPRLCWSLACPAMPTYFA